MSVGEVEEVVKGDMALQSEWVASLRPNASLLKFRLPYCTPSDPVDASTTYLDGKVRFQGSSDLPGGEKGI